MAQTNEMFFYNTIKAAQQILAEWILPDSRITDKFALSELLGILDSQVLVRKMCELETKVFPLIHEKFWKDSPNVERTYYSKTEKTMQVEYKNGNKYRYTEFPLELWNELIKAESIGSFLHRYVKGCFSYYKV